MTVRKGGEVYRNRRRDDSGPPCARRWVRSARTARARFVPIPWPPQWLCAFPRWVRF